MNDPRKEEGREVQGDRREVHQEWGRERERDRESTLFDWESGMGRYK